MLQSTKTAGGLHQATHYAYDLLGRLRTVIDSHGGLFQVGWNERDLPVVTRNARGVDTNYHYDAKGDLSHLVEVANSTQARIQNTTLRFEHDRHGNNRSTTAPSGATTTDA